MGSFWDQNKGYQYVSANFSLSNTHGSGDGSHSGAELHKSEIEHICNEIVDAKLSQVLPQIYQQVTYDTLSKILDALRVDVNSIVRIELDNAGEIFYGERAQTAIMEAVYKQMESIINSTFTIGA